MDSSKLLADRPEPLGYGGAKSRGGDLCRGGQTFQFLEAAGTVVAAGGGAGVGGREQRGQRTVVGVVREDRLENGHRDFHGVVERHVSGAAGLQVGDGVTGMRGGDDDGRMRGGKTALEFDGEDGVGQFGLRVRSHMGL